MTWFIIIWLIGVTPEIPRPVVTLDLKSFDSLIECRLAQKFLIDNLDKDKFWIGGCIKEIKSTLPYAYTPFEGHQ